MLKPPPSPIRNHRLAFARAVCVGCLAAALSACAATGPVTTASFRGPEVLARPTAPLPLEAAFHPAHVGAFFDPLSHYGSWRSDRGHWIWRPSDPAFAPFTDGAWTLTEHGPTWVSGTAYGWAVEHYGVWRHSSRGWEWRPDTHWAPARVAWRIGAAAVGWGPDIDPLARRDIAPEMMWRFVDADAFFRALSIQRTATSIGPLVHDVRHNPWFLTHSRHLPRWEFNRSGRLVARGVAPITPTTSIAALDPERTRWHGRSARQQVAGTWTTDGVRGPRAAPDKAERRGRAPPSPRTQRRRFR